MIGHIEHRHRLVQSHNVHQQVHGAHAFGRFNAWLAVKITRAVGTMPTAYLFAAISLVALPAAIASHDPIIIVAWVSQAFLQLCLLPIIIVGQNVQAAATDERALHDHETLTAIHQINVRQLEILEVLRSTENKP